MKTFVAIILILAFMVTLGIISDIFLGSIYNNMSDFTQQIKAAASDEDYERLWSIYEQMNEWWEKKERLLTVVIDHSHISDIDRSMSEIRSGIFGRESIEALLAAARVETELELISRNEHFNINNIL